MEAFADIILGSEAHRNGLHNLNADRNICAESNTTYISRIFHQRRQYEAQSCYYGAWSDYPDW